MDELSKLRTLLSGLIRPHKQRVINVWFQGDFKTHSSFTKMHQLHFAVYWTFVVRYVNCASLKISFISQERPGCAAVINSVIPSILIATVGYERMLRPSGQAVICWCDSEGLVIFQKEQRVGWVKIGWFSLILFVHCRSAEALLYIVLTLRPRWRETPPTGVSLGSVPGGWE